MVSVAIRARAIPNPNICGCPYTSNLVVCLHLTPTVTSCLLFLSDPMPPIIDTAALAARAISAQDLRARFEPNDAQKFVLLGWLWMLTGQGDAHCCRVLYCCHWDS